MDSTHAQKLLSQMQANSRADIKILAHDICMHTEDLKWLKSVHLWLLLKEKYLISQTVYSQQHLLYTILLC